MTEDYVIDGRRRSFIAVPAESHFPIQNLPFGVFSTEDRAKPRVGVAIGDQILDLSVLEAKGLLPLPTGADAVFDQENVNAFIALGRPVWRAVRSRLAQLLDHETATLRDDAELCAAALVGMAQATMHLPLSIGDYTDFYSSKEHATNVGMMFRDPKNALLPNWLHIPIGYNGRASSVVVDGTSIRRPSGQIKGANQERPEFSICYKLDFELETAFVVGLGNGLGEPIEVDSAESHIFGMVLMNDWSARDIQQWEYVPLGPFNAKTFATSISPWVVTLDALAPFRVAGPAQVPEPLPYLRHSGDRAVDLHLEVLLRPRDAAVSTTISRTNFRYLYWSMAQQLAHHTVSGCNTRIGDLMGSGTISGPTPQSFGSLLELSWNGRKPLTLDCGNSRTFLEDGDEVVMTGWCQGEGFRVGFGRVGGRIASAGTR